MAQRNSRLVLRRTLLTLPAILFILLGERNAVGADAYDPLAVGDGDVPPPLELVVHDAVRNRDIPLLAYLPPAERTILGGQPIVVLFSHGLGGTRAMCAYLGNHWAARGYAAIFLQHPGSDDSVWRDKRPLERMAAMRAAASLENLLHRVKDVPAVLDSLERWNTDADHELAARLDLKHVGMSGHSFGAVTTQAVSGQAYAGNAAGFTDARIKAAIAFSPGTPRHGTAEEAFGGVTIPWLLMTGTNDTAPVGGQTVESRLAVFPALPPGEKYELVLEGAEHSAFTDRPLPGDREERNPNHHRAILAISTAFWDVYLRDDAAAKAWLDGEGPRSVLQEKDRWQKK